MKLLAAKVPRGVGELAESGFEAWEVDLHGHQVIYRAVGSGPPVVLIHGMVNSSRHWREVAVRLAERHTVIAPDLIGHGDSATPRGDYSIGAHAAAIRDLLTAIDVHSATIVGHSLGGGIAMQFFWQFPERVERLALVSSGGLGAEVSPLLRAAALPGASAALRVASAPRALDALSAIADRLERRRSKRAVYLRAVVRALQPLQQPGGREAFVQTLRSVIDARGQRVSALDRLYLLGPVPTLVVWGERDNTIPLAHGRAAHELIPNSRFETLPRAAHFPHLEDPEGLAAVLSRFIDETQPHRLDDEDWAKLIASRAAHRRHLRVAA
jgi:pimeloyl-ACP methyl ester carboxylesterase